MKCDNFKKELEELYNLGYWAGFRQGFLAFMIIFLIVRLVIKNFLGYV